MMHPVRPLVATSVSHFPYSPDQGDTKSAMVPPMTMLGRAQDLRATLSHTQNPHRQMAIMESLARVEALAQRRVNSIRYHT